MRTHEEHGRWVRMVNNAQISALEDHGIVDKKVKGIIARAYDVMSDNCEGDDPALWSIDGDDMWSMLDGWGIRPDRISKWFSEDRQTERFRPTKSGVAALAAVHDATKAAWNAPVA